LVSNPFIIVEQEKSDITMLPDLPQLSGLPENKLAEGYLYSAPIFALFDADIPAEMKSIFSNKGLNAFCSLGSSGFPETLKTIIALLKQSRY